MSVNIYVGNLSYNVSEGKLNELFSQFGEVSSVKLITDQYSGRSKGFAFVEMNDKGEASAAIEELDGKEIDGRDLKVNTAKPKKNNQSFRKRY